MGAVFIGLAAVSFSVALFAFAAVGGTWIVDVWRRSKRGRF